MQDQVAIILACSRTSVERTSTEFSFVIKEDTLYAEFDSCFLLSGSFERPRRAAGGGKELSVPVN